MNVTPDTLGVFYVKSVAATHFRDALIQNAVENESISLPSDWSEIGLREMAIIGISVQGKENLEWDIFLWSGSGYNDADLDTDRFVDYVNFTAASGKRNAGAGQYYYPSASNLAIPYRLDKVNTGAIHCSLVNRSAGAKTAGAGGEIQITFMCRPVRGI